MKKNVSYNFEFLLYSSNLRINCCDVHYSDKKKNLFFEILISNFMIY